MGSLSIYPPQPGNVVSSSVCRANHYDESKPPIRKRPSASEARLRSQPESRARDLAVTRKIRRAPRFLLGRPRTNATAADRDARAPCIGKRDAWRRIGKGTDWITHLRPVQHFRFGRWSTE